MDRYHCIRFVPYHTVSGGIILTFQRLSLVGLFASVDPVGVDIDWLRQVIDGRLEVLQADSARNEANISLSIPAIHSA